MLGEVAQETAGIGLAKQRRRLAYRHRTGPEGFERKAEGCQFLAARQQPLDRGFVHFHNFGYQQDLPFGFSAGFQPSYYITRYDEALAAFGKTRSDNAVMLAFTLLNRRFDYHGFTPRFSYVFTEQHSNIALYSYTRSQFQIGVTSLF